MDVSTRKDLDLNLDDLIRDHGLVPLVEGLRRACRRKFDRLANGEQIDDPDDPRIAWLVVDTDLEEAARSIQKMAPEDEIMHGEPGRRP